MHFVHCLKILHSFVQSASYNQSIPLYFSPKIECRMLISTNEMNASNVLSYFFTLNLETTCDIVDLDFLVAKTIIHCVCSIWLMKFCWKSESLFEIYFDKLRYKNNNWLLRINKIINHTLFISIRLNQATHLLFCDYSWIFYQAVN